MTTVPPATETPETEPPVTTEPIVYEPVSYATGSFSKPFYKLAGIQLDSFFVDSESDTFTKDLRTRIDNNTVLWDDGKSYDLLELVQETCTVDISVCNDPRLRQPGEDRFDTLYRLFTEKIDNPISKDEWQLKYRDYEYKEIWVTFEPSLDKAVLWSESCGTVGILDKYTGTVFPMSASYGDRFRSCTVSLDGANYELQIFCERIWEEMEIDGVQYNTACVRICILSPRAYDGTVLYIGGGNRVSYKNAKKASHYAIAYEAMPGKSDDLMYFTIDEPVQHFSGSASSLYTDAHSIQISPSNNLPDVETTIELHDKDGIAVAPKPEDKISLFPDILVYESPDSIDMAGMSPYYSENYDAVAEWSRYYDLLNDGMSQEAWLEKYKDYKIIRAELEVFYPPVGDYYDVTVYHSMGILDKYTGACVEKTNGTSGLRYYVLHIDGKEYEIFADNGGKHDLSMIINDQVSYYRWISYMSILVPKDYDGAIMYYGYSDHELTSKENGAEAMLYHNTLGNKKEAAVFYTISYS